MTWREGLVAWKDLEQQRPVLWRCGAAALVAGGVSIPLMEAGTLSRPPEGVLWALLAALSLLALVIGRRVLWNDAERRLRAAWRAAGFMLLVISFHAAVRAMGLPVHPGVLARGSIAALPAMLAILAVVTLSAVIAVRFLDRRPARQLGIVPSAGFWGDLGFGLGLGALGMTVIFGVEFLAGWASVVDMARARNPGASVAVEFLGMTVIFVMVGFQEELSSRGYLLRTLAQGLAGRRVSPGQGLVLAALVSSALFGLGHAGNPHATLVSTLSIAVAGVMLSVPFVLTGRLATSIGLHTTWNLFQGVVYGFPVSGLNVPASLLVLEQAGPPLWTGGDFGPEAGLLGLLAELAIGALIVWREHRRQGSLAFCKGLLEASNRR